MLGNNAIQRPRSRCVHGYCFHDVGKLIVYFPHTRLPTNDIYIYIWATLHYNPDSLDCKVIVHYSHQPNVIHVPATWLEFSNMRDHVSKSGIGCPTIYRSLDWVISIAIILWHGFIGRSLSELPSAKLPWSFLLFRKQGSQV